MAYCTAQQPRRRLRRSRFRLEPPDPTRGAALLWPASRQALDVVLFSDSEQTEHFPLPFEACAEGNAGVTLDAKDIVIDLRRCGTFDGEQGSDAVRALWVWPPSRPLALFVFEWCQEQAASTGGDALASAGPAGSTDDGSINILELGAGTGICGLFAGQALSQLSPTGHVWLTDLNPASLQLIALNIAANRARTDGLGSNARNVSVGRLRWGENVIEPYCHSGSERTASEADQDQQQPAQQQEVEAEERRSAQSKRTVKSRQVGNTSTTVPPDNVNADGGGCSDGDVLHRKRRKTTASAGSTAAAAAAARSTAAGESTGEPAPPGHHGFRMIIASDIIIEDEAIPAVWSTVSHYLSREPGAIFVMTCVERPTMVFHAGVVSEEPVDTTLKAFVDDAAAHGFEAGEATTHVAAGGNGDGGADGGADGGVRTFVFCRAT